MPHALQLRSADPRRVGRYRITGRIEDINTADGDSPEAVFLAKRVDGTTVIVTLLGKAWEGDAAAKDRFAAEAHAARRVAPFCTARILDAGFEGASPYLVTEYVRGPSLAEVIDEEGALSTESLYGLAIGCATGLAAIHQAGLVHGQLSPETIVLGSEGPRVIHSSVTPPYGAATPAADMLAWADTVLNAAMGRPPVGPQDLTALPDDLRDAVAACLSPDPGGRPSARSILAGLIGQHENSGVLLSEGSRLAQAAARAPAPPGPRIRQPAPRGNSSRIVMWSAAFVTCLLAIVAAAVYITGQQSGSDAGTPPSPSGSGSSIATRPAGAVPGVLAGNWAGAVHQNKPALTVTVHLSLPQGSTEGTVSYPGLHCSGVLPVAGVSNDRLTVDQIIRVGQHNCENGVIKLLLKPDGTLSFTFSNNGPVGTLTRQH
jgi:Protein tyrosine and serine/threonine kinase